MKQLLLIIAILLIMPSLASAADWRGRFVINPVDGQAWFVRLDNKKLLIGRPQDSYLKVQSLAEPVSQVDLATLSTSSTTTLAVKFRGKIIKAEQSLYYLNPVDGRLVDISSIWTTSLAIARLSEKPSYHDFAKLHKPGVAESLDRFSSYTQATVTLEGGKKFKVDLIKLSLDNPNLVINTLAAANGDCASRCPAKNLADYVASVKGFAGINGSYFNDSATKKNYYFFPVYDSVKKIFINQSQLKYWTTGPIIAFDQFNRFYYFKDSREFTKATKFATDGIMINDGTRAGKLQAAIGNLPRLVEQKTNYLIEWSLDKKQRTMKSTLSALGYKAGPGKGEIILVTVREATLANLANVVVALGIDYALNIDGGGSVATFYNHEYMMGPGRDIPNAVVFSVK